MKQNQNSTFHNRSRSQIYNTMLAFYDQKKTKGTMFDLDHVSNGPTEDEPINNSFLPQVKLKNNMI